MSFINKISSEAYKPDESSQPRVKMTSNTIRDILISKPNNAHYLDRYLKLIDGIKTRITNLSVVKHHICPKANDMFPEYKSFKLYPWNCVSVTRREHILLHRLLYKIFKTKSQAFAYNALCNYSGEKNNYEDIHQINREQLVEARKKIDMKGKVRYFDNSTGKYVRIPKDAIPSENLEKRNKVIVIPEYIKKFHNPLTQTEHWIDTRFEIPDGLLIGRTKKFKEAVSASSLGNKSILNNILYHNPLTMDSIYIKMGAIPPEGFVKGKSKRSIEKSQQTAAKKQISVGKNNPNYGKKTTDDIKRKISEKLKGVTHKKSSDVEVTIIDHKTDEIYSFETLSKFNSWCMIKFGRVPKGKVVNSGIITSVYRERLNVFIGYEIITKRSSD